MSSDDPNLTKRDRQRQRRHAKREQQQAQMAKARRKRLAAFGLVGVVVVAAIGALVVTQINQRRASQENIAEAAARLDEVGCTEITDQPSMGGGHLQTDAASLAAADPATLYADRPATSGQHLPSVALSGVYDEQVDPRLLVHNLEHGYVNVYYSPDAPGEQVEALKAFARERIDGPHPKMIVSEYGEPLPDEANFATVAWNHRQLCSDFDEGILTAFIDQWYEGEEAPEPFIDAHVDANEGGVLDPTAEEGPLLFPPLGEGAPAVGEQPPGSSDDPAEGEGEAPPEDTVVPDDAEPPADEPDDAEPAPSD